MPPQKVFPSYPPQGDFCFRWQYLDRVKLTD
jgi:hypothetical protein